MLSALLTFITSILLGMRHATDPDHVVAVTAIVSRERSVARAIGVGALWGLGHTLTVFLVGGAIIGFKLAFTPRLGLSLEFAVALMLITLGLLNLVRREEPAPGPLDAVRPFLVGAVHGLAGSAAATLLILSVIDDVRWAIGYLVLFGLGTVVGMSLITLAIAVPSAYAADRVGAVRRWIRMASGTVSLAFGLYLAVRIGFVDGLFTATPTWTPE